MPLPVGLGMSMTKFVGSVRLPLKGHLRMSSILEKIAPLSLENADTPFIYSVCLSGCPRVQAATNNSPVQFAVKNGSLGKILSAAKPTAMLLRPLFELAGTSSFGDRYSSRCFRKPLKKIYSLFYIIIETCNAKFILLYTIARMF